MPGGLGSWKTLDWHRGVESTVLGVRRPGCCPGALTGSWARRFPTLGLKGSLLQNEDLISPVS